MMDAFRYWDAPDGQKYSVQTFELIPAKGSVDEGNMPRGRNRFTDPDGTAWTADYFSSTSLHRQPDFEIRAYWQQARHNEPERKR